MPPWPAQVQARGTPSFSLAAPAITMPTSANVMTADVPVLLATSTTAASTPSVGEAGRQPQALGEAGIAVRALGVGRDQVTVDGQVKQCLDVVGGAEPKLPAHQ
jgi:hypothetical protein